MLESLFSQSTTTTGARSLEHTAAMTAKSVELVNEILQYIEMNKDDDGIVQLVTKSQTDHLAMDTLVNQIRQITSDDIIEICLVPAEELEKMLKSQQSKRSRTMGKSMTIENYRANMSATICEHMIRVALNKPKGMTAATSQDYTGKVYTTEDIESYKADPELLAKEIRNVQSKKSIAKSRHDFSADTPRWQSLLEAEALLKSLRPESSVKSKAAGSSKTIEELTEILGTVEDISKMKGADSKDILAKVMDLIRR